MRYSWMVPWVALLAGCSTSHDDGASDSGPSDGAASRGADAAPAVPLVSECGFFDVPAQATGATFPARLFYSFRPADADAAHKPLALLFNGGPGSSTTSRLLAYGTGPMTLAFDGGAPDVPVSNPASWTSFANLLYVDMRTTGFSYGLGAPSTPAFPLFDVAEDAGDFVRALLAFYALHPSLEANPVIVVGESYGGTRAQYFLDLVLRYRSTTLLSSSDLADRLQAHFDAVFPARAGTTFDEATIASQFGTQVLIQALVLGVLQEEAQGPISEVDPYAGPSVSLADGGTPDWYNTSMPAGWTDGLTVSAESALSTDESATALLGVPLESIPELLPAARASAFRFPMDPTNPPSGVNDALSALLGELKASDLYFVPDVGVGWEIGSADPTLFVENLAHVRTFITHARYDRSIFSAAIPAVLLDAGLPVQTDDTPRDGGPRPGWFRVTLPVPSADGGVTASQTVEVRFPPYDSSGHMVEVTQPGDLHDDVAAWLAGE